MELLRSSTWWVRGVKIGEKMVEYNGNATISCGVVIRKMG
jgi:hypothetical protein